MPAAFTAVISEQVPGFEDMGLLTHHGSLICDFCSSGPCFACGFLQIPPGRAVLAVDTLAVRLTIFRGRPALSGS